uniref:Large ribosomal subunit protein uL24c n=1 Tax=Dictyopteris divaricata TaxID=156996 RepID=A0A2I4Q2I2_9PHAE|nr:50S ribosomal protein L24 [Dictyopteris divaricata]YP_010205342.1 50S ribosomal protein L24 [Grateloupia livida]AQZ25053.1 50S ribosomal protein L24 [Dictyopteris divaricata]UAV85911.1 50S ribosomal protein L24 [Grateloupia livida]
MINKRKSSTQQNFHIKLGEKVKVISGQEKGKIGLIKKIIRAKSKVIVEGINIRFKHSKSTRPGQVGEIKRIEFPIHSSNVSKYKE